MQAACDEKYQKIEKSICQTELRSASSTLYVHSPNIGKTLSVGKLISMFNNPVISIGTRRQPATQLQNEKWPK